MLLIQIGYLVQEVEDYKRTHSIDDGDFANADLDWDDIDVEIKEFMGSDYDDDDEDDDDDDDEGEDDAQEVKNADNGLLNVPNDDDNSKKRKADYDEERYDESGEFNTSKMVKLDTSGGDGADGEGDSSAADGESSDDEFERELLQELEENSEDEITSTPVP
ncbi:unnamed protein product [[Candida] boidinii]|nr:unnamed protein product [[Candida] boidinii]